MGLDKVLIEFWKLVFLVPPNIQYKILDVENIFYHSVTTLKIGSFWESIGSICWNLVIARSAILIFLLSLWMFFAWNHILSHRYTPDLTPRHIIMLILAYTCDLFMRISRLFTEIFISRNYIWHFVWKIRRKSRMFFQGIISQFYVREAVLWKK